MARPLRVLHVVPYVLSGGVERRRLTLARHLGDEFEQRLACYTARGPIADALRQELPLRALSVKGKALSNPRAHLRMHRLLATWRPDIVHAAIFDGMMWGGLAAWMHRIKVVLLEETSCPDKSGPAEMRRSSAAMAAVRALAMQTDGIVAVAPKIQEFLVTEQRIPEPKVHLVMNGVAEFALASRETALAERRRLDISDETTVLGGVGRVHDDVKRFSDLLRSVKVLRDRGEDVTALVVGDGGDLPMLKSLARELGIASHAVFTGRREDRGLFFAMMDIFVLSSATEAAPLGLMEAMLSGRPCVATTVGGVKDIAVDGQSALLVPPLSVEAFVAAVQRLLDDSGLADRLAEAAHVRALERFSGKRYAADVAALYHARLALK